MMEGSPPGDALPPPPQRATPARKGARCGAGAGSPRPHRPHPGHPERGTLAARYRGRAAGGGTAPDTRRPSQRWQAIPPGDGPPPPPRHAAPTGHAGQGDSVRPPHPHPRACSTWVADHNSLPSGRAVGRGGAPELRRPSQRWKAPSPGTPLRHPHSEQRRPARAHAVKPVLGPHARTDRTRDTRVAEPRLPAQRMGGRERDKACHQMPLTTVEGTPLGTPFGHPHSEQRRPARAHAVGPVLGPHARTDRTRDTRVARPRPPAPEDGRQGEGQRLTPDGPHNSGRPPLPETAPHNPRGTQPPRACRPRGPVLGPHTHTPAPTARGRRTPTAHPVGEQSGEGAGLRRPSQRWRAPPLGDALPPPPQRATPARKDARCGAGAGSPRPHRPHPGHTACGTPGARPRRRAAGGGTAPDTRRPSERWQATPPGDGPPPPRRHAAPTGHAGPGDSAGPPHRHTRAHSIWVADPNGPPSGRAVRGGGAPDLRRPSQRWKAPPPGTPFCHPYSEQRQPAGAHAVGLLLGRHARTDRTRKHGSQNPGCPPQRTGGWGRDSAPTPDAPHNDGRPPPPGTAPRHPRGTQPSQGMQAKGTVLGPHTHTPAPTACGWRTPTARPAGGPFGEEERLNKDAPNNGGRDTPRNALQPAPQQATPARKGARCGAGAGSPSPHGPHLGHTGRGTPAARPRGRAAEGGTAPDTRRPLQRWQATPPPGTALHHPHGKQPPQGMQA